MVRDNQCRCSLASPSIIFVTSGSLDDLSFPRPLLFSGAATTAATRSGEAISSPSFQNMGVYGLQEENWDQSALSICVVGASGDLAKKKIFPALFALHYQDMLPEHFTVFGYARSKMTNEQFRDMIAGNLTCRVGEG